MTIVAASIPILRVLIRDRKASYRGYYVSQHNDNTAASRSKLKSNNGNNTVTVTGGRRTNNRTTKDDDASEKSILEGRASPGKIIRKNEIVVEYEDRKEADSEEYEMSHMPA